MNQVLKSSVYEMGTDRQVEFIAQLGGMSEEEKKMFMYLHRSCNEVEIKQKMCLDQKPYDKIEERMRKKVLLAIFDCINFRMQYVEKM